MHARRLACGGLLQTCFRQLAGPVLVLAAAQTMGCRQTRVEEGDTTSAAPSTTPLPSAPAADQLAPGELVEGRTKALGVTLPRDLQVDSSFVDLVYASGPVGVHALAQYFRAHVTDGSVREGPDAATFEHVHAPGVAGKELEVRILLHAGGSRVELRDTTPPPLPALPDESARWRQVGLTPKGRLADPTHLD
jgi:hypothetical protein